MKHVIAIDPDTGPFCRNCHVDIFDMESAESTCKYGTEVEDKICPHCNTKVKHLVFNPVCELYECDNCRYIHR